MFDHDGVLVDSLAVFTAAFTAACREHGHPEIATADHVVALFHDNVYDCMRARGMASDAIAAIIADTASALAVAPGLYPFPGVGELLRGLAARFDVVVVTSNEGAVVRAFLAREGLGDLVKEVLGVEVDGSKVNKIAAVMGRYPGQSRCLYVGDTGGDMREGAAAGATPVGAGWGWHGPAVLSAAGAAYVAPTPADLLTYALEGTPTPSA
jgi:phosphoglycolate phosphatase